MDLLHFTLPPHKHFLFHQDLRLDMVKEVQPLVDQQVLLTVHLPPCS